MSFLGIDMSCAIGSLRNGEFPEKDCLLPLMSKLLGYCLVAASITVKLPQIMKILHHKSVRGLSVVAFELEVVGYTISLAYCLHKGLPFSAFGEMAFLLIQALILVACLYYFSQPVPVTTWIRALLYPSCLGIHLLSFVTLPVQIRIDGAMICSVLWLSLVLPEHRYCAVAPTILAGQIDPILFEALYASQHAIFLCARLPQIWKNFKNKSTGELSFLTSLMNFGGSALRVFTSIQENAPLSVTMGFVLGVLTNGTILSQILFYRKPGATKDKKVE